VTTAPSGWNGGAIAWSNDDSGLLYEIDRIPDPNAPPGPPVAPPSRMFSIDLSTASAQPVTDPALDFDRGLVFIPLAWDTSAGIAAALTTGEGGFAAEYLVWDKRAGTVKKTPFPWPVLAGSVRPSADGTVMLANEFQRDGGLRFWGIRDIGNSQRLTPIPDTARSVDASWRTGTKGDFAWVTGFSVSLYTFATDRVPILIHRGQSDVAILAWRPDGSGIVLSEIGRGVFVVDLTTLQATALPHLGNPLLGGVLIR